MHYRRWRLNGGHDVVRKVGRTGDSMLGAGNPRWAGPLVTYSGAHLRVRNARGSAKMWRCADCGGQASDWSYDHADAAEMISTYPATKGYRYSADLDHYVPRCVPCHKAFDLALIAQDRSAV